MAEHCLPPPATPFYLARRNKELRVSARFACGRWRRRRASRRRVHQHPPPPRPPTRGAYHIIQVFNLSERPYENKLFGARVIESGFPDHFAPPVALCWDICVTMDNWLSEDPKHIAVVHCLAGAWQSRAGGLRESRGEHTGAAFPPLVNSSFEAAARAAV